jgi:hypothetical protein
VRETFERIYPLFDQSANVLHYKPADGGWTVAEILEHITLTSHFLLIVADKGCAKAIKRAQSKPIDDSESDLDKLDAIGQKGAFAWIRPAHMEPKGAALPEVLATMTLQEAKCADLLDNCSNGEGSLFKVNMSVNGLRRIDLYQWIYFIAQHANRHVSQMEENLAECQKRNQ